MKPFLVATQHFCEAIFCWVAFICSTIFAKPFSGLHLFLLGCIYCREAALKFDLCKKTQSATRPGPARLPATCPRNCRFKDVRLAIFGSSSLMVEKGLCFRPTGLMAWRLMKPSANRMVVDSNPATTILRIHCEKIRRSTKSTRVLDCLPRTILEQNMLRGPHGLPSPMY